MILNLINGSYGGPRRGKDEKNKECSGALPCMEHLSLELDFNDLSALYEEKN